VGKIVEQCTNCIMTVEMEEMASVFGDFQGFSRSVYKVTIRRKDVWVLRNHEREQDGVGRKIMCLENKKY
jgi:hypothetical protein